MSASAPSSSERWPLLSWVRDEAHNRKNNTCPSELANLYRGGMCSSDHYERWRANITSRAGESILSGGISLQAELDGVLLLLIGDSLCRDQWVELVCALHKTAHVNILAGFNHTVRGLPESALLAHLNAPGVASTTVGYLYIDAIIRNGRRMAARAREVADYVQKLKARRTDLTVALHVCSMKAHSLTSRGYKNATPTGYFDDLAWFASELQKATNASFLYYRPGPATHFATADAGFIPQKNRRPEPCRPIARVSAQKTWFVREEEAMEEKLTARFSGKARVLRGVWALSQDAWAQHPGLTYAFHNKSRPVSDCLHYCIAGDGLVGVYEAFNRLWWWHMLADLTQQGPPPTGPASSLFSIFEDSKALSHALSTSAGPLRSYSEALYGRWVDLAGVRVLWPELMSTQLLDLLGRRFCAWLAFPSPSRLADPTSARFWLGNWPSAGRVKGSKGFTNASHGNLLQHGALWLHQPSQLRTAFVERHGWAEVTHCAYKGSYPKPLGLFLAQGSGVWMNVGNTLVLSRQMKNFSSGPPSPVEHRSAAVHAQAHTLHSALLRPHDNWRTYIQRFMPAGAPMRPEEIDSVQFVDWPYGSIFLTELVMLRWTESDWRNNMGMGSSTNSSKKGSSIRCGAYPELRRCTEDDSALRAQRTCREPMAGKEPMVRLLRVAATQCEAGQADLPASHVMLA